MITNSTFRHHIANKIYMLDKICRQNLEQKFIVSERDYISTLLTFIRYPFGPFSKFSFAHSQTMPGNLEQKYGVDGLIIFKRGNQYKIGVFEAKVIKYGWDSLSNSTSRFQNQLDRQLTINPNIAVWEMFLNNNNSDSNLDPFGSTCVMPTTARLVKRKKIKWGYKDLFSMFKLSEKTHGKPLSLYDIIDSMLKCTFGTTLDYSNDGISFYNEEELKIPLIEGKVTKIDIKNINRFLSKSKLFSYTHIDLDEELSIRRSITIQELLQNK